MNALYLLLSLAAADAAGERAAALQSRAGVHPEARALYLRHCAPCHGAKGDGRGPAALSTGTAPRDFTLGNYRYKSTASEVLPTDTDLFRTISVGLLGTKMPGWRRVLPARERWLLVDYLKSLSPRFAAEPPPVPLAMGPPPAPTPELYARGRALWEEMQCANCHGKDGAGDGPAAPGLIDDHDQPVAPFDLRSGDYRGGRGVAVVYRALTTGLTGTPMPSYAEALADGDRWALAYHVASLAGGSGSR